LEVNGTQGRAAHNAPLARSPWLLRSR
jgi:hypothetical protein